MLYIKEKAIFKARRQKEISTSSLFLFFTHYQTCQMRNQCCASCLPSRWMNNRPRWQKFIHLKIVVCEKCLETKKKLIILLIKDLYIYIEVQKLFSLEARCKTYRESRNWTASRREGVTSRCQTISRFWDVPKWAHNWFQIHVKLTIITD